MVSTQPLAIPAPTTPITWWSRLRWWSSLGLRWWSLLWLRSWSSGLRWWSLGLRSWSLLWLRIWSSGLRSWSLITMIAIMMVLIVGKGGWMQWSLSTDDISDDKNEEEDDEDDDGDGDQEVGDHNQDLPMFGWCWNSSQTVLIGWGKDETSGERNDKDDEIEDVSVRLRLVPMSLILTWQCVVDVGMPAILQTITTTEAVRTTVKPKLQRENWEKGSEVATAIEYIPVLDHYREARLNYWKLSYRYIDAAKHQYHWSKQDIGAGLKITSKTKTEWKQWRKVQTRAAKNRISKWLDMYQCEKSPWCHFADPRPHRLNHPAAATNHSC